MGEDCDVAGVPVNTGSGAYHEQDRPRAGIGAPMKLSSSDTPFAAGFRMPPEWEKHERTWISFPFDDELWEGHLADVREDVGRLIAFVSRFEPVRVNIAEEGDSDVVLHAGEEHGGILDRKSTRLNSSHVASSYAVFCLKKNTENTGQTMTQPK